MNTLDAGTALDLLVARHVLGLTKDDRAVTCHNCAEAGETYGVEPYSSDIAAAWKIVEKLCREHYWFNLSWNGKEAEVDVDYYSDERWTQVVERLRADTAPLAICRAAVTAVQSMG